MSEVVKAAAVLGQTVRLCLPGWLAVAAWRLATLRGSLSRWLRRRDVACSPELSSSLGAGELANGPAERLEP